jgi:hypothetical protein
MRANRAYEFIPHRGGPAPAVLADPSRIDRVEIVDIDSGEVVLFWDLPVDAARRVVRQLRRDLVDLEAQEFIAAWADADSDPAR